MGCPCQRGGPAFSLGSLGSPPCKPRIFCLPGVCAGQSKPGCTSPERRSHPSVHASALLPWWQQVSARCQSGSLLCLQTGWAGWVCLGLSQFAVLPPNPCCVPFATCPCPWACMSTCWHCRCWCGCGTQHCSVDHGWKQGSTSQNGG